MNQNSNVGPYVLALVAVVIAIVACFIPKVTAPTAGSITTGTNFTHGISIGNTATLGVAPSNLSKVLAGTCSLIAATYTVAASTTAIMDCTVPGVVATDGVFAQFASSTVIGGGGWAIRGASASSTAGFITIDVVNSTGASNVIPASIASTTKFIVIGVQ